LNVLELYGLNVEACNDGVSQIPRGVC
jgi:hypothetical protein